MCAAVWQFSAKVPKIRSGRLHYEIKSLTGFSKLPNNRHQKCSYPAKLPIKFLLSKIFIASKVAHCNFSSWGWFFDTVIQNGLREDNSEKKPLGEKLPKKPQVLNNKCI